MDAALNAGYSILIYDRLGCGQSEKADAYDVVQGPTEIEILHQLIVLARAGKLSPAKHQYLKVPTFDKIVAVGHSIGSILTSGMLTKYPDAVEGAILTGFLLSGKGGNIAPPGLEFARSSDPRRFHNFPSGYLVQATRSDIQRQFFHKGNFELDALEYAEAVKGTNTVGEIVGFPYIVAKPAPKYSGPLFVSHQPASSLC